MDPLSPAADPAATALAEGVTRLADWSAAVSWRDVGEPTRDRFALLLFDTLAVTCAGAALPENRRLAARWPATTGRSTALGHGTGGAERAAWLNGVSAVSLEMDCASRVTRGHAAAQSFFAVLAVAQEGEVSAARTCAGLLVAHEVASRFGRASTLSEGLHPHGSWAVAGAAAGAAYVMGEGPAGIAGAIDTAGGLMLAAPFSAATAGSAARNHWVGHTNAAGTVAARAGSAGAGTEPLTAPAAAAYDHALGVLDSTVLLADLEPPPGSGNGLALHTDFIKRHAACGYSHAVLDAVLLARDSPRWPRRVDRIREIVVETTATSAELAGVRTQSRLAAMFSLDYLVAAAAVLGDSGPRATDAETRADPDVLRLADRVTVRVADDLQARMPLDRGARVTVVHGEGDDLVVEVPNARWDPRHEPATWSDVLGKARSLLEPVGVDADALADWVARATRDDGPLPDLTQVTTFHDPPPSSPSTVLRGRA